jgi:hypothetical protein
MATTTVKTWDEGTEDDQNGLEIGGIKVTYAELAEIDSRETALEMGVTEDLLELWSNQGGRDYRQLVDWLYRYEAEQREEREISQRTPHAFAGIGDDQTDEDETPKNETDVADLIGRFLSGYYGLDVQSYEEAGVLTSNQGLVVRVTSRDGSATQQYQITVVRSR